MCYVGQFTEGSLRGKENRGDNAKAPGCDLSDFYRGMGTFALL